MKRLILVLAVLLAPTSAFAINHTWVSSTGTDNGLCDRTTPCATFQAAYTAVDAGGVISVLDAGDFTNSAPFNISKSVTVRAEGVDAGFVSTTANNAFLSISVAQTDSVAIEGLLFSGAGIQIANGGFVDIRNCVIRGNNAASASFFNVYGIKVANGQNAVKVAISDTVVENNGNSNGGAGVFLAPGLGGGGNGTAQVTLLRVLAHGNQFGLSVDSSYGTGGMNVSVIDSVITNNKVDGLILVGVSAPVVVNVLNSKFIANAYGIRTIGASAITRVESSKLLGNGVGVTVANGGTSLSAGNNVVESNSTNGTFNGSFGFR